MPTRATDADFLLAFQRGDKNALARCYQDHYQTVSRSVARYVTGSDAETVVHEVFLKLVSSSEARKSFQGGSMEAWLSRVGQNQAIDFLRRHRNASQAEGSVLPLDELGVNLAEAADARMMVKRFREECLPQKWQAIFEARFIRQLDQRSAARELGMFRTTLAYQELRIRSLLREYFLESRVPRR